MVDGFLRKMKDAIAGGDEPEQDAVYDQQAYPASKDPYGDPSYQQYGDVRPASEDPYG
ncbi:MAG TPA: translation initiation factor, partial [Cyanobacteria bacterium UBA8543]|nr:translation initiation factor [Cyanobacteria bacterium UBA8543]